MDSHNILSLLGLALRGGNLAVGEEAVETAVQGRGARLVLAASDAAENTLRRAERFAGVGQCLWLQLPFTREELGRAVGRSRTALAAVTDIGLANALGRKLADLDPNRYGELSRRLELKNRRAQERRAARPRRERPPAGKRTDDAPPFHHKPPSPANTGRRDRWKGPPGRTEPSEQRRAGESGPPEKRRSGGAGTRTRRTSANPRSAKPRNPYAHSRPVKKGKGSFRKREDGRG